MKNNKWLFVFLLVLLNFGISFFNITRGHNWGGDFSQYIMQAQSIVLGSINEFMLRNEFTINQSSYLFAPNSYPWGFPLLLTPIIYLFGIKVLALKLVGVFFYSAFLIVLFIFASLRLKEKDALLVTAFFAFNPSMQIAINNILADIPFLFFSTLSIFLVDKYSSIERENNNKFGILIGIIIFLSFTLRANGLLLFGALGLIHLNIFRRKKEENKNTLKWLKLSSIPYISFAILYIINIYFLPNGQTSYYLFLSDITFSAIVDNIPDYFSLTSEIFTDLPGKEYIYWLFLFFFVLGVIKRGWQDIHIHFYIITTYILFIIWPFWEQFRWLYPILPFFILFGIDGMVYFVQYFKPRNQKYFTMIYRGFLMFLIISSFSQVSITAKNNMANNRFESGPFDPNSYQIFSYIRDETPENSVIVFFRPRVMRMLTNRDSYLSLGCDNLMSGDYVVLYEPSWGNYQIHIDQIEQCNSNSLMLQEIKRNPDYRVFSITLLSP
ncbi:MAG: hypothetical protein FVQ83_07525 [Chloroflexi bacterium]|nr:hypothetical protein [Chloroflexota bacterium]